MDFMPEPIVISMDRYLNELDEFIPYTQRLFDAMNREISPRNPCTLIIDGFDPYNYAEFRKPNLISVFLGSLLNNLMDKPTATKKACLAMCLIHELYHANQNTSMVLYGKDPEYCTAIEEQAQYSAIEYLKHNREYFISNFEFDPYECLELNAITHTPYVEFNSKDYYINTIIDVFYRNELVRGALTDLISDPEYPNVGLRFDDFQPIWIKKNNQYDLNQIPQFNNAILQYRVGTAVMSFKVNTILFKTKSNNPKENSNMIIHFITEDRTYEPIEFRID